MEIVKKEIEYLKTHEIKSYVRNMRTHSAEQVDQIIDSIKEFGFTNPILIDKNNIIIAGHGRLEAAKKMRLSSVPCIRLDELNEEQVKALRIADNQLALNAGWDFDLLKAELDSLQLANFDLKLTGFSENELKDLVGDDLKLSDDDNSEDESYKEEVKSLYSVETKTPIYEPLGLDITLKDCLDITKVQKLIKDIEKANISDDEKTFLKVAAYRHSVFNYKYVAEYYAAHASKEMQQLMEDSALVIIDFKKAIENGYVRLTERIQKIIQEEGIE